MHRLCRGEGITRMLFQLCRGSNRTGFAHHNLGTTEPQLQPDYRPFLHQDKRSPRQNNILMLHQPLLGSYPARRHCGLRSFTVSAGQTSLDYAQPKEAAKSPGNQGAFGQRMATLKGGRGGSPLGFIDCLTGTQEDCNL